jgi:serine/threonine-protein kinase
MRCPACLQELGDVATTCSNCGTVTIAAPPGVPAGEGVAAIPAFSQEPGDGRFVPGTVLGGRYRVVAMAGRGGMGEVYRATDLLLNVPVALKFLPEGATNNDRALSRLYSEVRIAHQVSHPNVCRVFDIVEAGGLRFLSMEFIDGEDLRSLLRRIRRVPADRAVEIGRALCNGLQAAHDKGILHRDLKPSNIMIDRRGHVRITDFGLAGIAE